MSTKPKVSDCGLDGLTFTEPSLCKPQFADDCELSNIIHRFLRTGELPQTRSKPTISDATDSPTDLFEAIDPAVKARQAFDQLPFEERNRFNNDPETWLSKLGEKIESKSLESSTEGNSVAVSSTPSSDAPEVSSNATPA